MSEKYEQVKEKAYTVGLIVRVIPNNWGLQELGFKYYLTGKGYKMQQQRQYPLQVWSVLALLKENKTDFFKNLNDLSTHVDLEFEKRKQKYLVAPIKSTGKNKTLFRIKKMN